jgi:Fe-Mn family superoxide dismutase
MQYTAKNFDHLLGTPGFSDTLLKNHFTLYQGYVTNTNKLSDILDGMLKDGKAGTPEYNELKRRMGWEFDGMRLHEYYFGNMSPKSGFAASEQAPGFVKKVSTDFGSFENWEKDFRATGAMRGIGWAVLYHDTMNDRLFNVWINEHDVGHFAGCTPILIMDVFEHAFMLDYGTKRADYIEAFMKAVDWEVVEGRLK